MKLKLDENIGRRGLDILRAAGHDVMTVRDQQLQGAKDELLFEVCAAEGRALVTLDHDFGQLLRFPPEKGAGIAILEIGPRNPTRPSRSFARSGIGSGHAHPIRRVMDY